MCVTGIFWVMFVKSGFISGGCCSTLKYYDRDANKIRTLRTEDCEIHERKVYASRDFGVERKMLNILW